jgi:hypothetical protein
MPTSTTPRANTETIDTPTGACAPVSLGRSSSRGGGLLCWTLLLALAGCDSLTKANGGDGGEGGNNDPDLQDNDNDGVVARDDCDDDDPNIKEKSDWFVDKDGDGHGSDADTVEACYSPTGYAAENDDCNDAASTIFPGADEVCNGVDDDCDSAIDDSDDNVTDPLTWFPDGDNDGFGTDEGSVVSCVSPSGHVADGGDCDDTIPEVNPGVAEVCNNGLDDDCDGDPGDCALDAQFELSDERPGLQGSSSGDFAGWSVSAAGDINADGLNDVLVGAPYNDRADYNGGATYLVYGTVTSWTLAEDAAAAWYGEAEEDQLGWAVSGPGDLNGDGADDIAIGVPNQDGPGGGNAGGVRVVLNPGSGISPSDGDQAIFNGQSTADNAGFSVSGGADVTGDGGADLIVGAPYHDAAGNDSGAVYVVAGPLSSGTTNLSLTTAAAKVVGGRSGDTAGWSIALAGDVNGDGLEDLLIGAREAGTSSNKSGGAFLLYGPLSGAISLNDADIELLGELGEDHAGTSVAGAGDINNDGFADILVGAPENDGSGANAGAAYLLLSATSGAGLAAAELRMVGEAVGDSAGRSVTGAGDVDHDGFIDLMVGAPYNESAGSAAGSAYLVSGTTRGTLSLGGAAISFRGEVTGISGDAAGTCVAGAGDVNGDDWPDLLIGAPQNSSSGASTGAAYLIQGLGI